jgi:hypothetical protein
MMNLLFGKEGMKIVCGGTTAAIAARYLRAPLTPLGAYEDPDVPPVSRIAGVDLVTEGALTVARALTYLEKAQGGGEIASDWYERKDGASLLARSLLDDATDVNFLVGGAINRPTRAARARSSRPIWCNPWPRAWKRWASA